MAGKPSGRYPHDRMQWASAWQAANNDWPALADAYAREFGEVIHVDKLRLAVRYWERGQAEAGVAVAMPPTREANDLRAYMGKGRKLAELTTRFGMPEDEALGLVNDPPPGLTLFIQRDVWNEPIYAWLRQTEHEIKVLPRTFDCYSHYGEVEQERDAGYFHLIQFPELRDDVIQVVPLYDVHYGHQAHQHARFMEYVRWIEEHENVYWIGGGDLLENALDDGRGYSYDSNVKPENQMLDMTRFLAPIAHKGLCMLPGNHEERTMKRAGIDPTRYIADRLQIPFFNAPVNLSLNWNSYTWGVNAQHGRSNAQTWGGKFNAAARPAGWMDGLHFVVSGHTHTPLTAPIPVVYFDLINKCMAKRLIHVVVAQPFLGYTDTYAHKAGYAPPGWGACNMNIYASGDYDARRTDG